MFRKAIAIGAAAIVAVSVLGVATAGAQAAEETAITVDVTKQVTNALQQDATFVVKLTCTDDDDSESASQTVQWHAPGNSPWHLDPEDGEFTLTVIDTWDSDVTCVVSEPTNGGATSTSITCVDDSNATCDGAALYIDEDDLGLEVIYGEFEVVNDFTQPVVVPTVPAAPVEAAAATVVVVSPRFTG